VIDYNEGLGLIYERFVLNEYLTSLLKRYPINKVLEAPVYGMAGITGINSVPLAQAGCEVTLVDSEEDRIHITRRIWDELGLEAAFVVCPEMRTLPFADGSFDLAWEWAGLWYLKDAESLLKELARVSRRLVFVAMPNRWQVGYIMRKYLLEPEFFRQVDERWVDIKRIKAVLSSEGLHLVEEGVLDVPPWPDTVMPAAELLKRLGIKSAWLQSRFTGSAWHWSIMDYYTGKDPGLKDRVMRYAFLEKAPLPWWMKVIWAHHRFLLFEHQELALV